MSSLTSSVSRSSKCTKIIGGWDFPQTPLGELTALPQTPYLDLRRPLLPRGWRVGDGRERGEETWRDERIHGAKMICPRAPETIAPPLPKFESSTLQNL